MGVDHSSLSKRTSLSGDGMSFVMKNNFRPLLFHQIHGENIKLLKNNAVASRPDGFCKGIAFSDRPVKVGEPIFIKFLEISSNWSGALRIGFTMNDPASIKSKLPTYVCPDLTSIPGNWAKAVPERLAKQDSVLYYYVDYNGDVHFGIDSEEHGVFFGSVNTSGKLWAVLDIYGNTVKVEFINPSTTLNPDNIIDTSQSNFIGIVRSAENQNAMSVIETDALSFHCVHGKNIFFGSNNTIASRKIGSNNLAYVFTANAVKLNEKIAITISQIDNKSSYSLIYGITSCNPSSLHPNEMPEIAEDLIDRPEYWIVEKDSNLYEVGDTIVYCVSNQGEVTVLKNGTHKSAIFHVDPTLPLWLFFDLSGSVSEIALIDSPNINTAVCDLSNQFETLKVSLPLSAIADRSVPGPSAQQAYSECVICYEDPVDCALYKCGHMCMCYNCATKMWKSNSEVQCPICREVIKDVIKVYRSVK